MVKIAERLYCTVIPDNSGDFEALAEYLEALELPFSSWKNQETGEILHTVYAEDAETGKTYRKTVDDMLPEWRACGFQIGAVESFELPREDWTEVWKKYFHVIEISPTLAIRPTWIEFAARPGQAVVDLDPGMSFGTGQHATTAYCLAEIDRLAGTPGVSRLIDAGCGSGILAIAAAKRGYAPIDAFDFDPDAVRIAAENAELNRVAGQIRFFEGDAANWRADAPYDLAAVNILAHLLIRFRHNIIRWVRPGGFLLLAGILESEFDAVRDAYSALGFRELNRGTRAGWTGGTFVRADRD